MAPHQENGTLWRLAARCTEMSRAKRVREGDLFMLLSTFMFHLLCPTRIETTGEQESRRGSSNDPHADEGRRKDEAINFFGGFC